MLRLQIDGRWEPEDFIEVLTAIESLYYKATLTRSFFYEPPFFWFERSSVAMSFDENMDLANNWLLAQARTIARPHKRLGVARIQYASPGGIDLIGLGKACEAIANIIERIVKFFAECELRKQRDRQAQIETSIREVELDKEHESLRRLKIENARAILELRHDYPGMPDEILTALISNDQDKLIPRIAERKLITAKSVKSDLSDDQG